MSSVFNMFMGRFVNFNKAGWLNEAGEFASADVADRRQRSQIPLRHQITAVLAELDRRGGSALPDALGEQSKLPGGATRSFLTQLNKSGCSAVGSALALGIVTEARPVDDAAR